MKEEIRQLAKLMALKACDKKDIKTTAEGKSMLNHTYKMAETMLEELVESYLRVV